jgi:hypothetical protein
LTNLKSSVVDLKSSLTTKINDAVSVLESKIDDLEARLDAVEDKIEGLLARIQSVSYIPEYADGKVLISRFGATSSGELSFRISPKDAVVELEKVWSTALSCEAFYPKTRAVSLVKLAVTEYVADAESGIITVKISGEGLSEEFFAGTQEASVALTISDGNNSVTSEYVPITIKDKIKISSYGKYVRELLLKNHLEDKVFFLGKMNAEEMKAQFLKSATFVCPSVIENSPNSLGEAMLLGVPCVTAEVGGITSIFNNGLDGIAYPGYGSLEYVEQPDKETAQSKVLAHAVLRMWSDEEEMKEYSANASAHARRTHDSKVNYNRLVEIYRDISNEEV